MNEVINRAIVRSKKINGTQLDLVPKAPVVPTTPPAIVAQIDPPAPAPVTPPMTAPPAPPEPKAPPVEVEQIEAPETVDVTLQKILAWKRPYESKAELEFMSWLGQEIKSRGATHEIKANGNVVTTIPRPDKKAVTTLFSCHTDTMHTTANPPTQALLYDSAFGHIFLDKKDPSAGSCLGADDGAGVWLMLEMIKARIPGTYIFHRGEERGAQGASQILARHAAWLYEFEACVAFDRPNTTEVITHQGGQRCASDKYGLALAKALNSACPEFKYDISQRGVFTDNKLYRRQIAECVNLGVGYHGHHSMDETLDYVHLLKLRDACLAINWDALPIDRDPALPDPMPAYVPPPMPSYRGYKDLPDDDWYAQRYGAPVKGKKKAKVPPVETKTDGPTINIEDEFRGVGVTELVEWMERDPEYVSALVLEMASEAVGLRAQVNFLRGNLK